MPHRAHGLQLWAALPQAHEENEPSFTHTPQSAIPQIRLDGAVIKVLIGTAFGQTSPVATYMQTLYLDVVLQAGQELNLADLPPEAAIYPISGELEINKVKLALHSMALLAAGSAPLVRAVSAAQFVVIGGEPLQTARFVPRSTLTGNRANCTVVGNYRRPSRCHRRHAQTRQKSG